MKLKTLIEIDFSVPHNLFHILKLPLVFLFGNFNTDHQVDETVFANHHLTVLSIIYLAVGTMSEFKGHMLIKVS